MQHQLLSSLAEERKTMRPYAYGMADARLSQDALENNLVQYDKLHAVMPSGVELIYPGNTSLPPLNIKERFEASSEALTIYLGLPLWYDTRGNALEPGSSHDWRAKRIYKIVELQRVDENSGENPQPMQTRHYNARLMFEDDDRTDMEVLPLLRVVHAAGEAIGLAAQDPNFLPPCQLVTGSPTLRDMLRDLTNALEAARREMVVQMTRAGFSVDTMRGTQFQQMLRLKTLNRFAARLPSLVEAPSITPFEMYLELRELLAELAALHPDRDREYGDVSPYNHDRPAVAFLDLSAKVRSLLKPLKGDVFQKVPFTRDGPIFAATLSDDNIKVPNEYYVGVKTRLDPREVSKLVADEDKFKLTAKSMWQMRIRGVKLIEERHPPLQFPSETGLHYFRMMRDESKRIWERIEQEKVAAIWWPEIDASDFTITMYMTIPEGKA
jgi:type VI secretion system protein ImpJ